MLPESAWALLQALRLFFSTGSSVGSTVGSIIGCSVFPSVGDGVSLPAESSLDAGVPETSGKGLVVSDTSGVADTSGKTDAYGMTDTSGVADASGIALSSGVTVGSGVSLGSGVSCGSGKYLSSMIGANAKLVPESEDCVSFWFR